MTTLKEFRDDYYGFSSTASEVCRKLGFAGIAVVWIFKAEQVGKFLLSQDLLWAGVLIVASLSADLFQYVWASLIWGWFWRTNEKRGVKDDKELKAPRYLNWPTLFFFWGKLILMGIAYVLLLKFLLATIGVKN